MTTEFNCGHIDGGLCAHPNFTEYKEDIQCLVKTGVLPCCKHYKEKENEDVKEVGTKEL